MQSYNIMKELTIPKIVDILCL